MSSGVVDVLSLTSDNGILSHYDGEGLGVIDDSNRVLFENSYATLSSAPVDKDGLFVTAASKPYCSINGEYKELAVAGAGSLPTGGVAGSFLRSDGNENFSFAPT